MRLTSRSFENIPCDVIKMSFRRLPFQFSTDNPADRHSELMRRFGVPTEDKMFIDSPNIPINVMDGHSSPRLQHRLPGFLSGEGRPVKVNHESYAENVDSQKKEPKVRVVPIQLEGDNTSKKVCRQRVKSGGAAIPSSLADFPSEDSCRQRSNSGTRIPHFNSGLTSDFFTNPVTHEQDYSDSTKEDNSSKPREFNIPIVLEGGNKKLPQSRSVPIKKETVTKQSGTKMGNGPCISKSATEPVVKKVQKPYISVLLKQIEDILKEFETFKDGVDKFAGVQGDKQYRYLDEMLTRCMLKLDNIETMGNEEVRQARKAAVRQVQSAIDNLDSKVQTKAGKKSEGDEIGMDNDVKDDSVTKTTVIDIESNAKGDSAAEESAKEKIESLVDSSIEQVTQAAGKDNSVAEETVEEGSIGAIKSIVDASIGQVTKVADDSAVNLASNDIENEAQIQLPLERNVSQDDENRENGLTSDADTKNGHPCQELLENAMEVDPTGNGTENSAVPVEATIVDPVDVRVNETPALTTECENTEGTVPSVNGVQDSVSEEDKSMDLDESNAEIGQKRRCELSENEERTGSVENVKKDCNEVTDAEMDS